MNRRVITKLLVASVLCTGVMMATGSQRASANHIGPPGSAQMPAFVRNGLRNACGHTSQSPAFAQWVSLANAPATTSTTVASGTPSITLTLHFSALICYSTSDVPESRLQTRRATLNPPATLSPGFIGQVFGVTWQGSTLDVVGEYRHVARNFTYSPQGGFTQTGPARPYDITLDNRIINRFSNNSFRCVSGGGNPGGWNYQNCPVSDVDFTIMVAVQNPPQDEGDCSVSAPSGVYPGSTFTASFVANNTGDFNWSVNNATPGRWRMRDPTFNGQWGSASETEIRGGDVQASTFGELLFSGGSADWDQNFTAPNAPGRYTFDWRIYHGGVGYLGATCTETIDVVERPYFRTYGGDVFVGGGQGTNCAPPDTDGAIMGVTHTTHTAAGSQLANFALGFIMETASAQLRGGAANPKDLSFANTSPQLDGAIPGAGLYTTYGGGLHTDHVVCAPDFWQGATNIQPDNHPIGATNLGLGQRTTIFVDGDVFINGNITYANGNYNSVNQIPSFRLIARGNIYVAPGVTELNGLFVAQARSGAEANTSGRFYTCYPGHIPTAADMNGICRSANLTVYGAVVAELIKLTRSDGSAHQSSAAERYNNSVGSAAEKFIYTPEVWLTSDLASEGEFNSVLSLPPVL